MFRHRCFHAVSFAAVSLLLTYGVEAAAVPAFTYNRSTGVLRVDAALDPGTTLVSWLVPGPGAAQILAFQDGTNAEGSDWIQGYFDGKEQWIAVTGDGIAGSWDVAHYTTGLDITAFGQVEYGLRYSAGGGSTGFAAVTEAPALPGDLNGDGYVGLDDLQPILDHWNQTVTLGDASMGDVAGPGGGGPDGYVGLDDLQPVLDHWNEGTPPGADVSTLIPEPASVGWWCVLALVSQRRWRPLK